MSSGLILDQFGLLPTDDVHGVRTSRSARACNQPDLNFAPQVGYRVGSGTQWPNGDPRERRNVLRQFSAAERVSGSHQPLVERAIQPQPDALSDGIGAVPGWVGGEFRATALDIATQICGQPIGATVHGTQGPVVVRKQFRICRTQFLAAQSAVTGGPNVYSLANSVANFGGLLAPGYRTPRVVHMCLGIAASDGGAQLVLRRLRAPDRHAVSAGDRHQSRGRFAAILTDGSNPNPLLNTYHGGTVGDQCDAGRQPSCRKDARRRCPRAAVRRRP